MVNVAILGFGTVGSGVAEVLTTNGGLIDHRVDDLVRLKYIVDVRDFPDSPYKDLFVKDFAVLENDPELDIVVETIGGATIALDFTTRALKAGKSVVTSNKELVATHGYELLQLAREHGCSYLFEASVGGGIPILRPLTSCLAANELEQVTGILNGTTNYILTRMIKAGLTFDQALAFGRHVYPDQVPTQGIRGVALEDVAYADSVGCKIKLLGRAIRQPEGKVCAFVAPHLVPGENPLSGVEDVFNAIAVTKDLKRDRHNGWEEGAPDLVVSTDGLRSAWYVRVQASVEQARSRCGDIQLLARSGAPAGEAAFLTAPMTEPEIREKLAGLDAGSLFRVLA